MTRCNILFYELFYQLLSNYYLKTPKGKELQQIAPNHSYNIDFKDFMKISYSFLVNDNTLSSDNLLRLTKNLL